MKTILCLTALFLATGSVTCIAQSDSRSLAEIARQNQPSTKAVKAFTDENTQRTAPSEEDRKVAPASRPEVASSDSAKGTAAGQKKDAQSLSPASTGSAKVAELQKKVDSLRQNQAAWSSSAKAYENKLANETSDFRRQVYLEALENDRQNVESYQSQIDDAQAALSRARKAAAASQSSSVNTQESARASNSQP